MNEAYELGFMSGVDAYEKGVYNCAYCMDLLRQHNWSVKSENGKAFVQGWKESL